MDPERIIVMELETLSLEFLIISFFLSLWCSTIARFFYYSSNYKHSFVSFFFKNSILEDQVKIDD